MIKEIINTAETKMQKTISVLNSDLSTMKAGRANPTMLDRIHVDYYGSQCQLSQVANISAPEPRMLVITPWEKTLLKELIGHLYWYLIQQNQQLFPKKIKDFEDNEFNDFDKSFEELHFENDMMFQFN